MIENNELQLKTGPYKTTYVGTEIIRKSSKEEWINYGEILKRVDEAKQWAIGDWLVDGKRHYGDGLYDAAVKIVDLENQTLRKYKMLSERFDLLNRFNKLTWRHHYEVASLKKTVTDKKGKLQLSDEPDTEKMQEFLNTAEKEKLSIRDFMDYISKYKRNQQEEIRLANEPNKFVVIYADPPWQYDNSGFDQSAESHYQTMPVDKICSLRIPSAEKSILFLWATNPLLPEALKVMDSWGFKYVAAAVWVKDKAPGIGWYFNTKTEIVLVGTKGGSFHPANKIDNIINGVVGKHSKKPDEMYSIIERLYPGPTDGTFYLELFARSARDGWSSWGNEV